MTRYHLTLEDNPTSDDVETVSRGLEAYNVSKTGVENARQLAIFLRDDAGQIVGGLCGWTFWGWLAIDLLWLDEGVRGQEYGTRLVEQAEQEALARGCGGVLLHTMSFQAPDFYRKIGYEEYAVLEGFAGEHRRHHFHKRLGAGSQSSG
jgi:GNAT superfamily N-acetyltransferase